MCTQRGPLGRSRRIHTPFLGIWQCDLDHLLQVRHQESLRDSFQESLRDGDGIATDLTYVLQPSHQACGDVSGRLAQQHRSCSLSGYGLPAAPLQQCPATHSVTLCATPSSIRDTRNEPASDGPRPSRGVVGPEGGCFAKQWYARRPRHAHKFR